MAIPKRKSIRFHSTPLETALLDLKLEGSFRPTVSALVANESYSGCAIIVVYNDELTQGQELSVKIGEMDPLEAKIVWVKVLEENIKKIGLEFDS